jgi:inner membrane protein
LDNVCHTLVGAALAKTGFDRRTPLAGATMMIGANFPDIDVVAVPFGTDIAIRRGITHGVPAHIILPFVLAALVLAWDRWVRRRRDPSLAPAVPREILVASAVSIATHPFLDWCNSYGMRWLMPMRNEWFYGDSLFIVDPWLWIALFAGYYFAKRWRSATPARVAVVLSSAYIVAMMIGTLLVRDRIEQREATGGLSRRDLMVSPVALDPFARQLVLADGESYRTGRWSIREGIIWGDTIPINRKDPAVALALRNPEVQPFLHWSRFPFFNVYKQADGRTAVQVSDARYSDRSGGGWASRTIVVK